jgi:predicted SprT family Zn-dependent metalloprotease
MHRRPDPRPLRHHRIDRRNEWIVPPALFSGPAFRCSTGHRPPVVEGANRILLPPPAPAAPQTRSSCLSSPPNAPEGQKDSRYHPASPFREPAVPFELIPKALSSWMNLWAVPGLENEITLEFSSRMTRSLGRCDPTRRTIRISRLVADAGDELLREVLCHEAAHVAAVELHGPRVRPHGAEWKGLMRLAGLPPRARIPIDELPPAFVLQAISRRPRWEHRCAVCDAVRTAGRPVRNWRCVRCVEAGLSGMILITRLDGAMRHCERS